MEELTHEEKLKAWHSRNGWTKRSAAGMKTGEAKAKKAKAKFPLSPSPLTLTLPYPPSVNTMYATYKGRRILSKAGREFKKEAGAQAMEQGATMIEGEIKITYRIFRPRRIGDLDNRIKATQDALKGICFADDSQVCELHAYRAEDKENPRVVVEIESTK